MSANVGAALLGLCLGSGLGLRGEREDSCVLPFIEPRQQHDLHMEKLQVRRLPVINKSRRMIGILSLGDIMTYPPHDVANASVTGQSNLGGGIAIGGVGNPRSWRLRLGSRRDRNRRCRLSGQRGQRRRPKLGGARRRERRQPHRRGRC
jgi:hypothetical protein